MIGKNNPFNIRYTGVRWLGLDIKNSHTRGFCNFVSRDYGIRCAAYLVMHSYRKKGIKTIPDIIRRFAPPSENLTDAYIKYCLKFCQRESDYEMSGVWEYQMLLVSMSIIEGNPVTMTKLTEVFDYFDCYFDVKKDIYIL